MVRRTDLSRAAAYPNSDPDNGVDSSATEVWEAITRTLLERLKEKYTTLPEVAGPDLVVVDAYHGLVFQPKHRAVPGHRRRKPGPQARSVFQARRIVFDAWEKACEEMDEPGIQDAARLAGYTASGFRKVCRQAGMKAYEWPPSHRRDCPNHPEAVA